MECVIKCAQKNEFQIYSDHSALYPTVCLEGKKLHRSTQEVSTEMIILIVYTTGCEKVIHL
jgi:hypothetical protein